MATRTVIAMGERMPEVAAEFYQQGPRQCAGRLAQHLAPQVEAGVLAIDDIYLAAAQFLDLTQSTLKLPILFGSPERPRTSRSMPWSSLPSTSFSPPTGPRRPARSDAA